MFVSAEPDHPPRRHASILHADLDAFFASVEQRDDPRLRGRPVIVGGGVVMAASYEAKAFGIRAAMSGRHALRACPEAIVVEPRFTAYTAASKAVFKIFRDTTPLVEGLSIDEAFLDVGGLRRVSGPPREIATRLRQRVLEEVGLRITVGIAGTKFLAKVASGVAKPDGLLEVAIGSELQFLHPLVVERLWGVGKVTSAKLHGLGVHTVGDVAALDESTLVSMLGKGSGRHLFALAHNRDARRVQVGKRRRSMGAQRALGRRGRTPAELDIVVIGLVDRVTNRMRDADRRGRTVVLRLRFDDFTRVTRSRTISRPTAQTPALLAAVRELLAIAMPMILTKGLTLVGISVTGFEDDGTAEQLELPFPGFTATAVDSVLDDVRHRFGSSAMTRGVLLGRDQGMSMPMLPD
jgi:DNA polymerase-4